MHFKKGIFFLTCGWATILITGYVYQLWLAHHLPKTDYGDFGLVLSLLLWIEMIIINGIPYAVQRYVSARPNQMFGIFRSSIRIQCIVSIVLFVCAFFSAPFIAMLFKDSQLTGCFRVAFLDILLYGFFNLFAGFENGRKRFDTQAILLIVFALGRLISGVILTSFQPSVRLALLANPIGSFAGVLIWLVLNPKIPKGTFDGTKEMIKYALPSLSYFMALNLAFNIDVWIVRYFLGAEVVADYNVALLLAKIPFLLFFSVGAAIMPIISSYLSKGQFDNARDTIGQAIRILWILVAPVAILLSVNSHEILPFLFGAEFIAGAQYLRILMWSMASLSFIFLFTTALNADHRPHISLILTTISIVISAFGAIYLIEDSGGIGVSIGMLFGLSIGALLTFIFMFKRYKVFLAPASFLRISLAAGVLWPLTAMIPGHGFFILIKLVCAYILYWILLVLVKEIHRNEFLNLFARTAEPS